jgi:hypothetical protein
MKQLERIDETVFSAWRRQPETGQWSDAYAKQWSSVMWDIINILYREYCLARLTEMRRCELSN